MEELYNNAHQIMGYIGAGATVEENIITSTKIILVTNCFIFLQGHEQDWEWPCLQVTMFTCTQCHLTT